MGLTGQALNSIRNITEKCTRKMRTAEEHRRDKSNLIKHPHALSTYTKPRAKQRCIMGTSVFIIQVSYSNLTTGPFLRVK